MKTDTYELNYEHETTHWWFLARRDIVLARIEALIESGQLPKQPRVLDYGCGTGATTQALERIGQVEGIDPSAQAIAFCRDRGMENIRLLKAGDLPAEEAFDLATCLDVLEHHDDDLALLRALRGAIKPGGVLMVTVPAFAWLWGGEDVVSHHWRRYTRTQLTQRLEEGGFRVLQAGYFNTWLFPLIAGVRLFNRFLRPKTLTRSDVGPVWPPLNRALYRLFRSERFWVNRGGFAVGASILAVAVKPAGPSGSSLARDGVSHYDS